MIRFSLKCILLIAQFGVLSCSYDGLDDKRRSAYDVAMRDYRDCKNSISSYYYWKAYIRCKSNGSGKELAGGCAHVAGFSIDYDAKVELDECNVFLPSVPDIVEEYTIKGSE